MSNINLYNIAISGDHGGVELKEILVEYLKGKVNIIDFGSKPGEKVDYPDQASLVVEAIKCGRAQKGIMLCGTGIGISIAANRHKGIRAALCHDEYTARMSRLHNNANVLVLGGRTTGTEVAKAIVDVWLNTPFEGGRHLTRIEKLEK